MFHPTFHIHSNTGRCFSAPTRKYCQAWVYCPNPSHGFVFPTPLDNPLSVLPIPFFFFLTLFFLPNHSACGISVPRPGIEPRPWQWKPEMLTSRPPGNSHSACLLSDPLLLPARWAQRSSAAAQSSPDLLSPQSPEQSLCQRAVRISERSDKIHFPNWPNTNTTQRRGGR